LGELKKDPVGPTKRSKTVFRFCPGLQVCTSPFKKNYLSSAPFFFGVCLSREGILASMPSPRFVDGVDLFPMLSDTPPPPPPLVQSGMPPAISLNFQDPLHQLSQLVEEMKPL